MPNNFEALRESFHIPENTSKKDWKLIRPGFKNKKSVFIEVCRFEIVYIGCRRGKIHILRRFGLINMPLTSIFGHQRLRVEYKTWS